MVITRRVSSTKKLPSARVEGSAGYLDVRHGAQAASRGRVGLCELFLARGAKDDDEHTALLLAIHKGHLECMQLLLSGQPLGAPASWFA